MKTTNKTRTRRTELIHKSDLRLRKNYVGFYFQQSGWFFKVWYRDITGTDYGPDHYTKSVFPIFVDYLETRTRR